MTPSRTVFVLTHVRPEDDRFVEDGKLIGVYATRANAQAAIASVIGKPGFRDYPDAFVVAEYVVDCDQPNSDFVIDG